MSTKIREISSKNEIRKFIKFQNDLYKGNNYYVPPLFVSEYNNLLPKKNPASLFCDVKLWVAIKDKKIVGRIGGIINHEYIKLWNKKYARFNWFDCIEDLDVAQQLFAVVEKWAKSNGMEAIYGPYGFTNLDKHGVLIEGYNEIPTISSNYNYPYYKEFIEKLGYKKDIDWVERNIKVPDNLPDKFERLSKIILQKNHLHFKEVHSKKDIIKYTNDLFNLYNLAYAKLYGAVRLNEEQKKQIVKQYYNVIDAQLMALIYNEKDEIIAFGISMPSLSKAYQKAKGKLFPTGLFHIKRALKHNDTIDLLLIGIRPDYQKKGINALLFNKIAPSIISRGFKYVETTQNLETNMEVQNQWKYYDARLHKRARSYIKYLD